MGSYKSKMKILRRPQNYNDKNFSILGDSISTLEGYSPNGYNVLRKKEDKKNDRG